MKRHIKHLIALLAVLAVPAVPMAVATAPAAAATNCQPQAGTIIWDGELSYAPYMINCTDTDGVRFHTPAAGYGGIWDITWGTFLSANVGGGYQAVSIFCNCTNQALAPLYRTPAYCGGQTHAVQPMYYYQVHSSLSPYQWGAYHLFNTATVRNIKC